MFFTNPVVLYSTFSHLQSKLQNVKFGISATTYHKNPKKTVYQIRYIHSKQVEPIHFSTLMSDFQNFCQKVTTTFVHLCTGVERELSPIHQRSKHLTAVRLSKMLVLVIPVLFVKTSFGPLASQGGLKYDPCQN